MNKVDTVMKLKVNTIKPKVLKRLKREIILDPVDIKYYNKLNNARLELKEDRKKNYKMSKETINNEIANVPLNEDIELRIPEAIDLNNFNHNNQNVHDTTIQDTIKKQYKRLKSKGVIWQGGGVKIEEILNYAKRKSKIDEERLRYILVEIYKRNSSIMNLDYSTELEILNMTWYDNNGCEKKRDQIINELYDCYDHVYKNIVCPTGVVSRLLNADIVLNPESSPRTIEMLREEMLNMAAKIRSDCENDDEYKKMNDEEQIKVLKERIIKKITETYINIISEETIQKELDTWIEYI